MYQSNGISSILGNLNKAKKHFGSGGYGTSSDPEVQNAIDWAEQQHDSAVKESRSFKAANTPESFGGQGLADAYGQGTQDFNRSLGEGFDATQGMYDPYMQQAQNAQGMQAAMSGAMGPEAQQQAMQNIQASPGQDFIRDRMKKSLMAQQNMLGDAGGGRTMQALQEQAGGWAMQDIDNQFNRLGQVAQPGIGMTNQLGGMRYGLGQQQGQNMMQGQVGAAGALQQEAQQQYGANVADVTARNDWIMGNRSIDAGIGAANAQRKDDMFASVLGAGATILGMSDRRVKENIVEKGTGKKGLKFYEFNYLGNDDKFEGYMADEIMEVDPNHVFKGTDGLYRVSADYAPVRI